MGHCRPGAIQNYHKRVLQRSPGYLHRLRHPQQAVLPGHRQLLAQRNREVWLTQRINLFARE